MATLKKEERGLLIQQQFDRLRKSYPNFALHKSSDGKYEIIGELHFIASYLDFEEIEDKYQIQIILPNNYPDSIPTVTETNKRIPRSFHRYENSTLCLGVPSEITNRFNHKKTVLDFVVDCVIPYLYAFSYFENHGKIPWDDLAHGGEGIIDHYKEIFALDDDLVALNFIKILSENRLKGHYQCPCGEYRIRNCKHVQELRKYAKGQQINIFKIEYYTAFLSLLEKLDGQIPYEFWNKQIRNSVSPQVLGYLEKLELIKK